MCARMYESGYTTKRCFSQMNHLLGPAPLGSFVRAQLEPECIITAHIYMEKLMQTLSAQLTVCTWTSAHQSHVYFGGPCDQPLQLTPTFFMNAGWLPQLGGDYACVLHPRVQK